MRRTIVAGIALALTVSFASVSSAQEMKQGERHARRGGVAFLLKGIELTDQQKDQLKALHQKEGRNAADKAGFEKKREEMKAARAKGDTASLRAFRMASREQMKQRHEQRLDQVRAILTPAQREVFEKNLAAGEERMKERMKEGRKPGKQHGEHGERGEHHGDRKS